MVKINKIGVVGCGQMGSGIVQVCARSGYTVLVSEVSEPLLGKGLASIEVSLESMVKKGTLSPEEKTLALSRIKGAIETREFAACDLVIEAAIEDLELKKKIFVSLDKICKPGTREVIQPQ